MNRITSLDQIADDDRRFVRALMHDGLLETGLRQFKFAFDRPPRLQGEAEPTDHLHLTLDELYGDSWALDRIVQVVSLNEDLDYPDALEQLRTWFDRASEYRTEPTTLAAALTKAGRSERAYLRDIEQFDTRQTRAADALADEIPIPDEPVGDIDERGTVRLTSADRGASLLTDDFERERAYLTAIDLGSAQPGDDGRAAFLNELRAHVEAGIDLPATLQLEQRRLALRERGLAAGAAVARWAEGERRRRAEERAAVSALQDAHHQLQRSRR